MARYREICDDLRLRIQAGEFPVGVKLPSIGELQKHYGVSGLNTVRSAIALLVEEGMLEVRHGVGTFVVSSTSLLEVDVATTLTAARDTLRSAAATVDTAIAALGRRGQVVLDLYTSEDTVLVLLDALRDWGSRQVQDAANEDPGDPMRRQRQAWADEAQRLVELIEAAS